MSASEGQPSVPLRPIPIHLPPPPPPAEFDTLRFRLPGSLDKTAKSFPRLWNPALDHFSRCADNETKKAADLSLKTIFASQLPSHAAPVASLMPASSATKSFKKMESSHADAIKTAPLPFTTICKQLERHFPGSQENHLAVLTAKAGLFPILLGVPGSMIGYSTTHPTIPSRGHQPMSQGYINFQNALNLAHSRPVTERITSSQVQIPTGSLRQQHGPHQHHHSQQQNTRNQHPSMLSQLPPSIPPSDRPMQNALSLAQPQAFLAGVNSSPVLSPGIVLDNVVSHSYGRKLFPCSQCRYTTDRRNNLKRHMLTMHQTSAKMLECCGILFNTKASLREHAMIFHYHGYTCYFCGRRFCRKALLKRHLSVHNGQKDFVCHVCDYATSHKSNLERHRKVHSRQGGGNDDEQSYHDDDTQHYHDDGKSNASEAVSHDDMSSDELSVCSDYDDDIDEEINVHSD